MRRYSILIAITVVLLPASSIAANPQFQFHYIRANPHWVTSVHQVVLADLDNDGDLDWTVGNVHRLPNLFWYEYRAPDDWVEHYIGGDEVMYGGAAVLDVNRDGWKDLVATQILYVNKGQGKGWLPYNIKTCDDYCHDQQAVDINSDGKTDILSNSQKEGLNWYEAPQDPMKPWIRHEIGGPAYRVHAGPAPEAAGDLDGDGDTDVVSARAWFENRDGKGLEWTMHAHVLIGDIGRFGLAVKTVVRDMDNDGDLDIVQAEADQPDSDLAWLENTDGKGAFRVHWIKRAGKEEDYHSLQVFDYDGDHDWDVFTCAGPLTPRDEKNIYLFENLSGKGTKPREWKEHTLRSGPDVCHEALAGDVDADGDIDVVIKGWTSGSFEYMENRRLQKRTDRLQSHAKVQP
jgi:hypothetical protein